MGWRGGALIPNLISPNIKIGFPFRVLIASKMDKAFYLAENAISDENDGTAGGGERGPKE